MRVLLVYKRSFMETQKNLRKRWRPPSVAYARKIERSDHENRLTKQEVLRTLAAAGVHIDILWRGHLSSRVKEDLVITVGGDGTFFSAAHHIRSTPIMAVNSDPENSLALFSCADRSNFRERFDLFVRGRLKRVPLARFSVTIGRRRIPEMVINDLLFAHQNPAALSRYLFRAGGVEEEQRSSGIWVSTAAGSTAAVLSAGGRVMPFRSRRVQYIVREPFLWKGEPCRLVRGPTAGTLTATSLMSRAMVFVDGSRVRYPVAFGEAVTISPGASPLNVVGFSPDKRRRLFA